MPVDPPAKSAAKTHPREALTITEILGHVEAMERRASQRLDKAEERASRERQEAVNSFNARIEAEADHAQKAAAELAAGIGERVFVQGKLMGDRLADLAKTLGDKIEDGDKAARTRMDDLLAARATEQADRAAERIADREDAQCARRENRALVSLMLLIIAAFGGLNLWMKADGSVWGSQAADAGAATLESAPSP